VLPKFDKIVYIIRDPRDAALSHARFVLTPYMKKYFPNDFESKEEYLEKQLEGKLTSWVQHVAPYIAYSDDFDIHVVFYERLLNNFADELDHLVDYLEITLTEQERRSVEEAVTFQSMKEENPEHVQKGKAGKWRDQMTAEQKRRSKMIAGPLLEKLGYPLQDTVDNIRPSCPETFTPDEAERMIERARHPFPKDKLKKGVRAIYRTFFS
jgi:aryl sulfotransferase